MSRAGLRLDEKAWDRGVDDGRSPVIVFCVVSSRIGTDIENAMRGVNGKTKTLMKLIYKLYPDLLVRNVCFCILYIYVGY